MWAFRDKKEREKNIPEEKVEENELTLLRGWGKDRSRDIMKSKGRKDKFRVKKWNI